MSVVEEIKARLDIVDVVRAYVSLKRTGKNYKALCPFHAEKTPSFVVFPDSQRWHCFGACGTGGDIFTFVMKREGVDFREAVRILAQRAGVNLTARQDEQARDAQLHERLRAIHAAATAHFQDLLRRHPEAEAARQYVRQRGLNEETVTAFQLGYALDRWDDLRTYLQGLGYNPEEVEQAGLVVRRDDGRVYDRFRGRLMIPIHDAQGRVVAFGGRVLGDGHPKYLNSPQSPIFNKSRVLYGYPQAVKAIRQADQAVIVEGYMDVLSAHQAGYRNVVASMGTALTATQLRMLSRHTRRIILALDADTAGQQAALRGVEVAREALEREVEPMVSPTGILRFEAALNVDLRVLCLPEGLDPDDLIRQDREKWARLVAGALPVMDFYIAHVRETVDLSTARGKAQAIEMLAPLLREMANASTRDHYIQQVARLLQVDERALAADVFRQTGRSRPARRPTDVSGIGTSPAVEQEGPIPGTVQDMEAYVMALLLRDPASVVTLDEQLQRLGQREIQLEELQDIRHRMILQALLTRLVGGTLTEVEDLIADVPEEMRDYLHFLIARARSLPAVSSQTARREAIAAIIRLRLLRNKEAATQLRFLMEEAEAMGDEHLLLTYGMRLGNHLRAIRDLERLVSAVTVARVR